MVAQTQIQGKNLMETLVQIMNDGFRSRQVVKMYTNGSIDKIKVMDEEYKKFMINYKIRK